MQDFAATGARSMSWPHTVTSPAVGAMNPAIMRMVVDLPAPFAPKKAEHFAGSHRKTEVVDGKFVAVALGEVIRRDHGRL